MSELTLICILLAILGAVWFVIRRVRYVINDEDEVDKRLRDICR